MSCTRLTVFLLAGAITPVGAAAQGGGDSLPAARTVRVVPGAQYDAGLLHRFLLGTRYRALWTTPIEVPVLDLATFAGGLTPTERGGGEQTKSLRFRSGDGREFAFRSVDKDPSKALPPALRNTAAAEIVRDQTSAGHPVGALVVAPILEATGVLHTQPHLFVLPEHDPGLGEFEDEFGGLLGTLEERPREADEANDGFAGATDIIHSDKLLEKLQKSLENRVTARAYLSARLVDVFLGDWDRHRDQWQWARFDDERPRRWIPIPRDRDQAFVRYDGFLLMLARASAPQLVKFGPSYSGMLGQTWNGRDLDRRLLVGLERPVWDSVARELQARLTDSVLESAVARLPPEYLPLDSARLAGALRQRRDHLLDAAAAFYGHLAGEVEVHATDEDELVTVTGEGGRFADVAVTRMAPDSGLGAPYFTRRFDHRETKEVRVFLHGGDDRVIVRGSGGGVRIRVIAGRGADSLADSSGGGRVHLYAADADDGLAPGGHADLRRELYQPPDTAIRDWGDRWLTQTWFDAGPDIGVFLGTGVLFTRYRFHHDPLAERYRLRVGWSTGASTGRAEFTTRWYPENSRVHADLLLRVSGIEVMRFHGFGNEVRAPESNRFYRVRQGDVALAPTLTLPLASDLAFRVGPVLKYSTTDLDQDRFIASAPFYGAGSFGRFGAIGDLTWDSRDRRNAASRGVLASVGGGFYPGAWDATEAFGEMHGQAATYLSALKAPLEPTLALRVGGKKVWGRYPFQEAAFIGDASTVRLGRQNRYAGDASLYANAELRLFLTRFMLLAPGDFGVFGLADVGRVYLEGEESDVWHAAAGGGIWASVLDRANTMSLAVARSAERTGVYLTVGFGF